MLYRCTGSFRVEIGTWALAVLCAVLASASNFPGKITPGFYPIVTPVATILCLCIVIRERKRIRKAVQTARKNAYIRPAGDLQ